MVECWGENGFPQEVQIVAEAPSVGKLSTFLSPTADSHRVVQKQCFLLLIDQTDMYFACFSARTSWRVAM